jgi:hypothetical protein
MDERAQRLGPSVGVKLGRVPSRVFPGPFCHRTRLVYTDLKQGQRNLTVRCPFTLGKPRPPVAPHSVCENGAHRRGAIAAEPLRARYVRETEGGEIDSRRGAPAIRWPRAWPARLPHNESRTATAARPAGLTGQAGAGPDHREQTAMVATVAAEAQAPDRRLALIGERGTDAAGARRTFRPTAAGQPADTVRRRVPAQAIATLPFDHEVREGAISHPYRLVR